MNKYVYLFLKNYTVRYTMELQYELIIRIIVPWLYISPSSILCEGLINLHLKVF